MDDVIKKLIFLTQDKIVFWIPQGILLVVFTYALYKSCHKNKSIDITVIRGEKSFGIFNYFATVIALSIFIVIINIAETINGHKIFIFLLDITIIFYLVYWNSWFRNKLIGWHRKIKEKKEKY